MRSYAAKVALVMVFFAHVFQLSYGSYKACIPLEIVEYEDHTVERKHESRRHFGKGSKDDVGERGAPGPVSGPGRVVKDSSHAAIQADLDKSIKNVEDLEVEMQDTESKIAYFISRYQILRSMSRPSLNLPEFREFRDLLGEFRQIMNVAESENIFDVPENENISDKSQEMNGAKLDSSQDTTISGTNENLTTERPKDAKDNLEFQEAWLSAHSEDPSSDGLNDTVPEILSRKKRSTSTGFGKMNNAKSKKCEFKYSKTCYWIVIDYEGNTNFSSAQSICARQQSTVADVVDRDQNDLLAMKILSKVSKHPSNVIERSFFIWTGLKQNPSARLVTLSSGAEAPYLDWHTSEPSRRASETNIFMYVSMNGHTYHAIGDAEPFRNLHGVACAYKTL